MKNQIGTIINITENIRPEYLSKKRRKHPRMVIIEIYKNKRYGAIAKIFERNDIFARIREKTTKKERKDFSKALKKVGKRNKPLDTSKWVKPDEESIRNELVECLFFLEIFKEDYWEYKERYGKAAAYYSILHSHSPKNPQYLSNFEFGNLMGYFRTVMAEFKSTEHKKFWKQFNAYFKKKNKPKDHWEKRVGSHQMWKSECLKNMIFPDENPPIEKDIFKESKKEVVTPMA